MAPAAWVFDAYGTLFDVHSVARRCDSLWPGKGAALSHLWRAKQLEYTWQRSLMQRYRPFSGVTRDALAYACEALGLELTAERMEAVMSEYLALAVFPDVEATLERLGGKKKVILSNGSPDMLHPLVSHSQLRFDAVLSVDARKVYKPAPETYELVLQEIALPRKDIGFVSSNCWDALGARSFGFRAWWINRTGAPVDRLGFEPERILRSLAEVAA